MKSNTYFRLISLLLSLTMILCIGGCSSGSSNDSNGIKRIEDIDQFDEVITLSEVQYNSSDYESYNAEADYFGVDEELEDKSTYKLMYKSDDCEVTGYLCAPSDYLKKKYPILIYLRGGNRTYGMLRPSDVSQLTNFGFIVMATQYRGNDGGTGTEDFGGADVQDVLSLIDIAQQLPFASGKIYMFGASRGGLQAYCTLKEEYLAGSDRISAAVVMSGVSDLAENYNFRDYDMKTTLIKLVGDTPERLPDEYEKRSVIYWPEMINVPLLIIHGRTDMRVPVEQAETIYDMLRAYDKDVELRLYDAGHSDFPPESYLDAFEWLLSH
jgi:dipeptidyl aminopeptidase/acylaminoacyl peptidase